LPAADADELKAQWRHWLDREMGWLDRQSIPLWQTTSNHTTYDIIHTLWTGLGGEGHVETTWLREVLRRNADARYKLVLGHHPVHPVNGLSGAWQREIGPEQAGSFWDVLVEEGVLAYLCGHILAFDVQVRRGVLQICTAGAGTAHRMPEVVEYLHCVQAALDGDGLRYQVLDVEGLVREQLSWPLTLPAGTAWRALPAGQSEAGLIGGPFSDRLVAFRFTGRSAPSREGAAQTLLCADRPGLQPPWHGPAVEPGAPFDVTLLIHTGMGPGGSPWGAERLIWPERSSVGHAARGPHDQPFRGPALNASVAVTDLSSDRRAEMAAERATS
jgi:hypothetical protein